jgi:ArsR family transcriptional regulator
MLLESGELCLCQIIHVLGLAPSTVSRHMSELQRAGLVKRRKEGRWHFYRRPGRGAPARVREALRWMMRSLGESQVVADDRTKLEHVRRRSLAELTACYGP